MHQIDFPLHELDVRVLWLDHFDLLLFSMVLLSLAVRVLIHFVSGFIQHKTVRTVLLLPRADLDDLYLKEIIHEEPEEILQNLIEHLVVQDALLVLAAVYGIARAMVSICNHLQALWLHIQRFRQVSEAAETESMDLTRERASQSHHVVAHELGLHTLVVVVLHKNKEVREIKVAIKSPLASIEDHENEDEFREFLLAPLLALVEVLEDAVDEKAEIPLAFLVRGKHVVRGGYLGAYVLENVEAKLQQLVEVFVLLAGRELLLANGTRLLLTGKALTSIRMRRGKACALLHNLHRCPSASSIAQLLYPILSPQHQTPDRLKDERESLREMLVPHYLDYSEEAAIRLQSNLV